METMHKGPVGLVSAPSLREQARQVIRGLVITGQMQPDQLYSVPRLAAELGVSATPVREALLDLEREGLLEAERNRGFRVVSLSLGELNDIFAVRLLLEVPSIGDIAQGGLSGRQLDELRQLAEATRQTADTGNLIAFLDTDLKFHVQLIATLGNQYLAKLVETLRDRVRLQGFANGESPRDFLKQSANEHFKLLDYIAKQDRSGAEATIRQHLERSRRVWGSRHTTMQAAGASLLDESS
jgi:DNA-binding GntR family transcriptional regulator